MSLLAIELNDSGILAASETLVSESSPGYAVLAGDQLKIGAEAFSQARVHPRKTNLSFWQQLSLDPLERASGAIKTSADLAFMHLQQVFAPHRGNTDKVIIGVPSCFSKAQLGLLLGICQQAQIPVIGLVDAALAAVNHPVPGDRMLVVDATSHSVLITELTVDKGLRRTDVTQLHNIGLKDFTARWAACISDAFVKTTRFDPMHTADSEQWLYNEIPELVRRINAGHEHVEITSADDNYKTSVDKAMIVSAVAGLYQPIVNAIIALEEPGKVTTVIFCERLAAMPGLTELLEHQPALRVITLPALAVPKTILREPDAFVHGDGPLTLILQRPWQATPSLVPAPAAEHRADTTRSAHLATHVLVDSLAYPISGEPLMLGTSLPANQWGHQISGAVKGISRQHCLISRRSGQIVVDDQSTYGTFVNGKRVEGSQTLRAGDRVQLGNPGIEVRIIKQVDANGQG